MTDTIKRPLLGVLGGMGTQATACFFEKLHNLQEVTAEQDYLNVLVYSKPSIPDRTAFITGKSTDNPLASLIQGVKTLEAAGSSLLAVLCVTSHYFYDDLAKALTVPLLSITDETALFAREYGISKIGLLATDGTINSGIFHKSFNKYNIEVITPTNETRTELMSMIYSTKLGIDIPMTKLDSMAAGLLDSGAQAVVLGCTELSVIAKTGSGYVSRYRSVYIDTLEVLAKAALERSSS